MIHLHLGIYDGDIQKFDFGSVSSLLEYMEHLKSIDCIWIVADDHGEILISENLTKILLAISHGHFDFLGAHVSNLYVQEYQSYEDAYAVALDMREGNPRMLNK